MKHSQPTTSIDTNRRQRWINVAIVVVVFGTFAATAWYYFSQCDAFDCPNVERFIRDFGPWTPLAYAFIYIVSSPIPFLAPVLSATGGLLFGAGLGTLYTIVIAAISALVPFVLARRLGREWVESKLKGKRLDEIYEQSGGNQGFLFILLLRLIPLLPWEIQNYVAGLTKVSVPTYILATMLGIIPGTFSLRMQFIRAFLGSSVTDPGSWQFWAAIALKVVTALIPAVAIYIRSRRVKQKESAL